MKPYYEQDGITIYHGDCRDVAPTLAADALISDPPYGIAVSVGTSTWRGGVRRRYGRSFDPIAGDDLPFDPTPWLAYLRVALFGANHFAHLLPPAKGWIVWDKRAGMASTDQSDCELIWCNVGGRARMIRYQFNGGGAIAKENGVPAGRGFPVSLHPTQKPLAVMRPVIEWVSQPSDVVLDPYAGSGSTLVAARDMGRRAIGIEIEERYCEIAAKRLAQGVLFGGEVA